MENVFFDYLLNHYSLYVVFVMGLIMAVIFGILEVVKIPYKKLTIKIKIDFLRSLANKGIVVLAFGLSTGIWFLLQRFAPQYFKADLTNITLTGTLPVVLYALIDGILTKGGFVKIINTIKGYVNDDGMIDKEETKDIVKTVAKAITEEKKEEVETVKDAEKELNKLLK